jgi:hypothetical protein
MVAVTEEVMLADADEAEEAVTEEVIAEDEAVADADEAEEDTKCLSLILTCSSKKLKNS